MKRILKKNKGFTLVELLAVIVILGLLMSIAVVGVTRYIDKSRRNVYIDNAKEYISIASQMIAKGDFVVRSEETVYYIHINNLTSEKDVLASPWGDWVDAYVIVVINSTTNNFEYYWTSVDTSGHRVDITSDDNLNISSIYISNDLSIDPNYPLGGRDSIVVYDEDGNKDENVDPEINLSLDEAEECYEWTESNGSITITGYNSSCTKNVSLPSTIDDKPVVAIGEAAFKNKAITNIYFYSGVTTIGYGAFQGNNISTVKLSQYITTISDYAFYNSKISTLIMSEGVTSIGSWSFANNNICSVELPNSLTSIGSYAFYNNCLTKLNLPSSSVSIGGAAFANNNISYADAFIYAWDSANNKYDYSTLIGYAGDVVNNIVIPAERDGVALKTISSNAFANTGLTGSVTIPGTVTYIGTDAFAFNSLTSVIYSGTSQLKTIKSGAFRSNQLTEANIPDSVTSVGNYAFVKNKMTGDEAFIYARTSSGIDYSTIVSYGGGQTAGSVVIPAKMNGVTLKQINSNAFSDCKLTSITLPDLSIATKLTIQTNAFIRNNVSGSAGFIYKLTNGVWDYSTLSSYAGPYSGTITIPETAPDGTALETIAAAFTWMSYSKIIIPSTVTTINSGVFAKDARNNQNLTTIVNKTGRAFDWQSITSSNYSATFVTGTIKHKAGDIEVTSS